MRQEYALNPYPPTHGDVPIPPEIFMHVFLHPGDHLGSMATEMLPKKLSYPLTWCNSINDIHNVPIGWGFYIIEGFDWPLMAWSTVGLVLLVTLLTICWSTMRQDVQGGVGIGQYCLAVLAILSSVMLLCSNTL